VTTRHTLVLTNELHRAILAGAPALTARPVASDRGVLLVAQHIGDRAQDGDVVVPLDADGLTCTSTSIAGDLPGPDGPVPAGGVRVTGPSWQLLLPHGDESPPEVYDRQVRAFGSDGQRLLAHLRVGVVGAGGTGSAVIEQLVRLGVGEILVIDPDTINCNGSNVTRVYGSTMADLGQPKVALAQRNADRIGLGTAVTAVQGTINDEAIARLLTDRDVVFGCTDDNRGRVTLCRLATWYLIPVIDMGVKLTSSHGSLRGIEGRITIVDPGGGCLQCRGRINAEALQAEILSPVERAHRVDEGYAVGLDERDPAVVTFTTGVAAHAVSELLHRVFALDDGLPSSELIIRFHVRDIRRNSRAGAPGHWCTEPSRLGACDTVPFLGTTWTS
jgi:molybdopterin/thiamine biosynthesis adenylyltransferase